MSKRVNVDHQHGGTESRRETAGPAAAGGLPHRLMTAVEVAEFVGCHEESVRRAYLCGQLKRQRFGVRNCRFDPRDVLEWIARGAPTRMGGRRGGGAASAAR
jgi:hypothetical protein